MSLRLEAAIEGRLPEFMESRLALARGGMMKAAGLGGREVLGRLRADVVSAGMGQRLANTWRAVVYPSGGRQSLSPTAYLFTRAPTIIAAYSRGATIAPVNGSAYLWIPTENVPKGGEGFAGRYFSPGAVEERFGEFTYIRSLTRPGVVYATVAAVTAKTKRGWRKASARRVASGREIKRIVMFVLVRQVRLRQRLNTDAIAAQAEAEWPEIVSRSLSEALRNGAR